MNDGTPAEPRSVTPGLENHIGIPGGGEPGVYGSIDWLRLRVDEDRMNDLEAAVLECFGPPTRSTNGAAWFRYGEEWSPGIQMSYGHRSRICLLDVRGERFEQLGSDVGFDLLRDFALPWITPTRIDLALDFVGDYSTVWDDAVRSCDDDELCRLRSYAIATERCTGAMGSRRVLRLGRRDSAVCARLYDKGLQTKRAPMGWWMRLEAEFKKDRAVTASQALLTSGTDWLTELVSLVVGTVDFRIATGRSEVDRRPRAAWWQELTGHIEGVRLRPKYREPCLPRWLEALRTSYGGRIVQLAEAARIPVEEAVAWMLQGVRPAGDPTPLVEEFTSIFATTHGR